MAFDANITADLVPSTLISAFSAEAALGRILSIGAFSLDGPYCLIVCVRDNRYHVT